MIENRFVEFVLGQELIAGVAIYGLNLFPCDAQLVGLRVGYPLIGDQLLCQLAGLNGIHKDSLSDEASKTWYL